MSRYERVSETPAVAGSEPPTDPPPPYEPPAAATAVAATAVAADPPPAAVAAAADADKPPALEPPPAYEDATNPAKLPSYADVQREKSREGPPPAAAASAEGAMDSHEALNLWRISSVGLDPEAAAALHDQQLLGTDFMFFTAFLAAFLLNWIGFLLLLCFCHSVAGRYGALAGFGLSLAKWTLIVKNSTTLVSHDNSWLWWLIMAFGLVISVRAMLQYLYIKREWRQLSVTARQRLIFFY